MRFFFVLCCMCYLAYFLLNYLLFHSFKQAAGLGVGPASLQYHVLCYDIIQYYIINTIYYNMIWSNRPRRRARFSTALPDTANLPAKNLPAKKLLAKIRWLKTSGKIPMGLGISPLNIIIMPESNPLKSRISVRGLAVRIPERASQRGSLLRGWCCMFVIFLYCWLFIIVFMYCVISLFACSPFTRTSRDSETSEHVYRVFCFVQKQQKHVLRV